MRFFISVAVAVVVAVGCASTKHVRAEAPSWWKGTLSVENQSHYAIHHLFLTHFDEASWGPDQLGTDVLFPAEQATLHDVDCDKYDLRLVDEDGDECVVEDMNLCDEDAHVELTDHNLLSCQGWSAAK